MKLTNKQLKEATAILTDINKDNIKSIDNSDESCRAIVYGITRSQVIKLDRLLDTRGIYIGPNDNETIRIRL